MKTKDVTVETIKAKGTNYGDERRSMYEYSGIQIKYDNINKS